MKPNRSLLCFLLIIIVSVSWQCNNKRTGQWCVYEIVSAEGNCPPGTGTKNFCIPCRTPCPLNFDTTVIKGKDTCYYTLRAIDQTCRTCPPNSLP